MTAEMDQMGQPNASAHDMEAMLVKLAEVGKAPTPGQLKCEGLKAKVITAMKQHGTLSAASEASGVGRSTIYRWRDEDKAFAAEIDQWMTVGMEEELVESMFKLATSTDPKMATAAVRANEFLLKAHNPEKYGDRMKVVQNVTINQQIQMVQQTRDAFRASQAARLQAFRAGAVDVEVVPANGEGS